MNKKLFKYDELAANQFVEELKRDPRLKGFNINSENANLFYMSLKSMEGCKNCKGLDYCKNSIKGFTSYVDEKSQTLKACECKYMQQLKAFEENTKLFKTLFEPENVLHSTFEEFDLSNESRNKAYTKACNFVEAMKASKENEGLIFYGDFGVGKTYLLSAVANELSKNGINVMLAYFPDVVREIKNSIGNANKLEESINNLKEVDVLMLDDFGSENLTPWFRDEILGPILNYRAQAHKPICISTNYKSNELAEHLALTGEGRDTVKAARLMQRIQVCGGKFTKIEK